MIQQQPQNQHDGKQAIQRNGERRCITFRQNGDRLDGYAKSTKHRHKHHEIAYHQTTMITTLQDYLDISNAYKEYNFAGRYDLYAFNIIDVPYIGQNAYMPLTVEPENQPVISGADVELAYFVINPYSIHQADSLAFIRSTVNAWSDMEKVLLQKSAAKPVQRSDYASEKATIESDLDALRTRLSASDAVGAATLQAQIDDKIAELNTCEDRRWDITQAGVDWYQSVVDRIVMSKQNPLTVLMEGMTVTNTLV